MKKMKKLLALLITAIMVMGMGVTAFAATITVPDNQHTYEILQIFTGDLSNNVLSNLKWGQNGTGELGKAVDQTVIDDLEALPSNARDTAKLAVIKKYVNLNSTPVATIGATSPKDLTAEGLANGYYLVRDKADSVPETDADGKPVADAYTLFVVKIVKDVTIAPKMDVPEVVKKILDTEPASKSEASIGDEVKYQFTGTMPDRINDYNTYYYVFTDTLSKGLTLKTDEGGNNDITVKVDGVDATNYFYKNATAGTNGTTIKVGISDIKALNKVEGFNITANTKVVVTYTAILNEDALIAPLDNPNEVELEYSNNPNDSGEPSDEPPGEPGNPTTDHPTGTTPKSEVKTYITEINLLKVDENGKTLTGAEFQISGSGVNKVVVKKTTEFVEDSNGAYWKLTNGKYTTEAPKGDVYEDGYVATGNAEEDEKHITFKNNYADYDSTTDKYAPKTVSKVVMEDTETADVKAFVDDSGKVTFSGLGKGSYTIKETTTPAGYNTIGDITFDIDWTEANGFVIKNAKGATFSGDQTFTTKVVNQSGTTLPETGGMGTRLFYIFGAVMVLFAGVLLVAKRRMNRA